MRPIDLPPADLDTVRRILRDHAPGLEARAFGSRVSWTARETSDLDLVLMTESPLDTGPHGGVIEAGNNSSDSANGWEK